MSAALKELPSEVLSGLCRRIIAVNSSIEKVCLESGREIPPRLVAVSKKQPVEKIRQAHHEGLRHFGENYVQELRDKSWDLQFAPYNDIRWHFIGQLQRNKTKTLLNVPGLWMVESVDSIKLASQLDKHWGLEDREDKLNIMVQVNTSEEKGKGGCSVEQCGDVASHVMDHCPSLNLCGLMTIGQFGHHQTSSLNPDFQELVSCGKHLQRSIPHINQLELSMGMSDDYLHAVAMGSTSVRVGTALFGPRES